MLGNLAPDYEETKYERRDRKLGYRSPPNDVLADYVLRYLFPWNDDAYPGIQRGSASVISRRLHRTTIGNWRSGRIRLPAWAALELLAYVEAHLAAGAALAASLRVYVSEAEAREAAVNRGSAARMRKLTMERWSR